jgi:hypothetical protein
MELARPLPTKMDRYKLDNHFWHLDETVKHFSGTETRLYFYWLNRFNKGLNGKFWPAEYPRWSKQVEADLGLTDKPLAAARKVLEQRGLLYYREGSKSKAPVWSLSPFVRDNSGQSEDISRSKSDQSEHIARNNSDESEQISRNNSGQAKHIAPNMSRSNSGQSEGLPPTLAGETPDSIRRRHKQVLEQEDTNKKNGGAGDESLEDVVAPSESEEITAPNPVALPLPPVSGTVAPCLMPGTEDSRGLAAEMAAYWLIPEGKNPRRWAQFGNFTRTLAAADRLEEVRTQFDAYRRYQQLRGISRYAVDKYLGHELEGYADGEWCGCEWPALLAEAQQQAAKTNSNQAPATPVRAGGAPSKHPKNW